MKLSWQAVVGNEYTIEHCPDFQNWQVFGTETAVEEEMRRSIVIDGATSDMFRIIETDLSSSAFAPSNLIANGGFEQLNGPVPLGWQKGGYGSNTRTFTYPAPGRSGQRSAKLTVTGYVNGDAKWFFNDIPVTAGSTYRYSDWYLSDAESNITLRFELTNGSYVYVGALNPPASPSWTYIRHTFTAPPGAIKLTVFHALTRNGNLTLDDCILIDVTPSLPSTGMISFDFDDGWSDTVANSRPLLESAGYKGTFYIVTERVNRPTVMSVSDLQALRTAGHEVSGHTITHRDLTQLDNQSVEREINLSRQQLVNWGITPQTAFAYPFNGYNANVKRLVREAGFRCASSTDGGINVKYSFDQFALKRTSMRPTTTIAEVKAQIDQAIAEKGWYIMVFHHVNDSGIDYSVTPAFLGQIINYAKSKNVKVVTASEGANLFLNP